MNTALLQDISVSRPLVISSYGELCDLVKVVLTDAGVIQVRKEDKIELTQSEYTTRQAKMILKGKGYQVKSHVTFKGIMLIHDITPVRKGKDDWWNSEKVNAIPDKR
jgi:hypothetical protein